MTKDIIILTTTEITDAGKETLDKLTSIFLTRKLRSRIEKRKEKIKRIYE